MQNGSGTPTVRLGDYFVLLRRQWLALLLCLALGLGAAVAYLSWAPREYRSVSSVLVTSIDPGATGSGERSGTINLDTEAQLVSSTETVAVAAEKLDGTTARELVDRVGVSVPPNTEILDIAYVAGSAAEAQRGSLAFAEAYLEQRRATAEAVLKTQEAALQARIDAVQEEFDEVLAKVEDLPEDSAARARGEDQASRLDNQLGTLSSNQARVRSEIISPGRIVTQPRLPESPSSPDPLITLAAGLLLGLVLGLGVAALRHRADDVVRTPDDLVTRTGVPVATVLSTRLQDDVVSVLPPLSADGRSYARLRNLVTSALEQSERRVVLVAGARRGGGPVAANLAASLARSGEEVVLVCADAFGSTAASLLPGGPAPGLAEVLSGDQQVDDVLRPLPAIPTLRILGPGLDPDRADTLMQTRSPRRLVDRLLGSASYVVVEAPSTSDGPDVAALAGVAEIAVLVVDAGNTRAREVGAAGAELESVQTAVLGAVIARYGRDGDAESRRRRLRPRADTPSTDGRADATTPAPSAPLPVGAAAGVVRGKGAVRRSTAPATPVPPTGTRPQPVRGPVGPAQR